MELLIVFICVASNHLGLVSKIEEIVKLPIINCPMCFSFWSTLIYGIGGNIIETIFISFMCAWLAIWIELFMGFTDKIYNKLYDAIYTNKTDEITAD